MEPPLIIRLWPGLLRGIYEMYVAQTDRPYLTLNTKRNICMFCMFRESYHGHLMPYLYIYIFTHIYIYIYIYIYICIYIYIYRYVQSYLLIILPSHVKQMVTSFLLSLSEDVTSIGIRRSSSISREAKKGHGIFSWDMPW